MTRRQLLALAAIQPVRADTPAFNTFLETLLLDWVRAEPELATNMRLFASEEQRRLDAQLGDGSDPAAHARISRAKAALAKLRQFDRSKLTADERISADMLEFQLNDVVAEEPYLAYRFPLNQFSGTQVRLPGFLTDIHPIRNLKDAENYLSRLDAVGPKIDQAFRMMQDCSNPSSHLTR